MKRDLQSIIKEAAARYGLQYNENQTEPRIERQDGTVNVIPKENFYKAFGIGFPKAQAAEKWCEIPEGKSVTWENSSIVDFDLTEDMSVYGFNDIKIVA